jgi:hypothetical protein
MAERSKQVLPVWFSHLGIHIKKQAVTADHGQYKIIDMY